MTLRHRTPPGPARSAAEPPEAEGKDERPTAGTPGCAESSIAAESQQRGALLRRLLAMGDELALVVALCVATAATTGADIATLFWAVLFSPVLVLVFKLHGLYDHDHRRIRHSTLDELPALVSASALGTLALDGLLTLTPAGALTSSTAILVGVLVFAGSFTMRAAIRFAWLRLTGVA